MHKRTNNQCLPYQFWVVISLEARLIALYLFAFAIFFSLCTILELNNNLLIYFLNFINVGSSQFGTYIKPEQLNCRKYPCLFEKLHQQKSWEVFFQWWLLWKLVFPCSHHLFSLWFINRQSITFQLPFF